MSVRDNERLEDWCRAVGPVAIDSVPGADFGSLGSDDTLAITAWNVDVGSGFLTAFLEAEMGLQCDGRQSRLREGAPHFVLLVQEALRRSNAVPDIRASWATPPPVAEETRPGDRLDVLEVAAACGLSSYYAPAGRNGVEPRDGLREDKGNAIVSTLPLADFVVIELPYEAARRVVPVATIRNSVGDSIRVASVHLITTPPPWRLFSTGNTARLRQGIALVAGLHAVELARAGLACQIGACDQGPGEPTGRGLSTATVVGGDLNVSSRRETALRQLRADFSDSPPTLSKGTRGVFPTDHLLFRTGVGGEWAILDASYRRIEDSYYSDHNPVIALFSVR